MGCEKARDLFSECFDGVSAHSAEFEQHLEVCPYCRREYEDFVSLLESLATLPEPEVSGEFHTALLSYVEGYAKSQKHFVGRAWKSVRVGIGSVAAAAALVLLVWLTGWQAEEMPFYHDMAELPLTMRLVDETAVAMGEFDFDVDDSFIEDREAFAMEAELDDADFAFGDDETDLGLEVSFVVPPAEDADFFGEPQREAADILDERLTGAGGFFDEPLTGARTFSYDFFEPVTIITTEQRVVRPHFLTAVVFLVVGVGLGYRIKRLVEYVERKINNAP